MLHGREIIRDGTEPVGRVGDVFLPRRQHHCRLGGLVLRTHQLDGASRRERCRPGGIQVDLSGHEVRVEAGAGASGQPHVDEIVERPEGGHERHDHHGGHEVGKHHMPDALKLVRPVH